ncbi:FAD-dependent oxidoreductase [Amycolatopsis sp. RTGN1]|uniref:FAD-dependent oxidoreductase n=1 Tax=Amycolatopsis ponsaeliensis TaxID=2992142 RepID=UPI00254B2997|nr:FAD-dependent oxidoreductase [Amycolatopsis sp. RTGN1]
MAGPGVTGHAVDLLVLGSGAAGLAAAVAGAAEGLSVLVLEKTEWLGGTSAYSAGTSWIPGHRRQPDPAADLAEARQYLDTLVGDRAPRELRESYLRHGPEAIEYFERLGLRFWHSAKVVVDYHPELPGSGIGRALEPHTFDARRLAGFGRVRWPIPELALFGGTLMVRRAEADQLLKVFDGSVRATALALRLGARWVFDRLRHSRGLRLTMGDALVAALYDQLTRRSGSVWFTARTTELTTDASGRVTGAVVSHRGQPVRVTARRGVVLAGGGFPANADLRAEHLPSPTPQFTPAAEGATGDTIALARSVGGALAEPRDDNALWFPSSLGRRANGSTAVFPHIWDRAKPGIVAVTAAGRRFVDESVSYHRFVRAMYAAADAIPAWLILDAHTLKRYGLGMIRPQVREGVLRQYIEDGYLHIGQTIGELAEAIRVDPDGLKSTVGAANHFAHTGVDEELGKGESSYGRQYGDQAHRPNVNLGAIEKPPFYAIAVVPTPLATTLGLRINANAQVLARHGDPVRGLYACGNDATSMTASEYPGAGCQIGAGLVFGYLAAHHICRSS